MLGPPQGATDQKVLKEYKEIQVLNEITLIPEGAQKALLMLKETLVTRRSRRCYCCSRGGTAPVCVHEREIRDCCSASSWYCARSQAPALPQADTQEGTLLRCE